MVAVAVCALGVLVPSTTSAELYKYETPAGDVLITTEKKPGYKLIEIISGGSKKSSKSSRSKKARKKRVRRSKSERSSAHKKRARRSPLRRGESAFDDIISEAARAYDVPFAFIKAVIRVESNFQPDAVSSAGAQGLMQLMPRTAASLNVTDAFDPRQNIYGGAKFLRILIDRYEGDINLILAAYNAGDAAVARYEGIPYAKTRDYVATVFHWYKVYSKERESQ